MVVEVEGVILEVKEMTEEKEKPETPEGEEEVEVEAEVSKPTAKKTIESVVKETFFAEIERLTEENNELKLKLENLSKVDEVTNEVTELADLKPISFNPENTNEVEHVQFGAKRPRTIMDSIIEKLNN